ncbi:MAG: hypothetical protein ACREO8_02400, partial [Luteimonas sp.]
QGDEKHPASAAKDGRVNGASAWALAPLGDSPGMDRTGDLKTHRKCVFQQSVRDSLHGPSTAFTALFTKLKITLRAHWSSYAWVE